MKYSIYIAFIIIVLLSSCRDKAPAEEEILDVPIALGSATHDTYFYKTTVSNLRLRSAPDVQSNVVQTLPVGTSLTIIDKTLFTEKIEIGGQNNEHHWYEVLLPGDSIKFAWVYGGGIIQDSSVTGDLIYIKGSSAEEVGGLLRMEGFDSEYEPYEGFYELSEVDGQKDLDGFWFVRGKAQGVPTDETYSSAKYFGTFKSGKPNGEFRETISHYEGSEVTTLHFKEGVCESNVTIVQKEETREVMNKSTSKCSF